MIRFGSQNWVRQSAHPRKLRKNHMVQAWVLGLSWVTGPVEQVRWIDESQPVELVFNLRV